MSAGIRFLFFLILSAICFSSCNFWNKNDDNVIYKPGSRFYFRVNFLNADGSLKKRDSLVMEVTNGFYPGPSQTEIVYTYFQSQEKDTQILTNSTGVVDSKDEFFIHPPRVGDLYVLSFADFPDLNTKVFTDTAYKYEGGGFIVMTKLYKGKAVGKVSTTSSYKGIKNIDLPIAENLKTYYTHSNASSGAGNIVGDYYFNEKFGFVKMDYTFDDSTRIQIELTAADTSQSE